MSMSESTGAALDGIADLEQSIRRIITTRLGSLVMRRDFGCALFSLVDAPSTPQTMLAIYAETAEAIAKWETRFALKQVRIASITPGHITLDMTGDYLPQSRSVTLYGLDLTQ